MNFNIKVILAIPFLIGGKIYFNGQVRTTNYSDQDNKVILVTGGNEGIGLETVRYLAQKKATIIIASRNQEKAKQVVQELGDGSSIEFMRLDLGDLSSIRSFVEEFSIKYKQVDVIINNAGSMFVSGYSTQGLEQNFAVNYLGPFYLTLSLIPLMKNHSQSRIINVASRAHESTPTGWSFSTTENANQYFEIEPNIVSNFHQRYSVSKLCNILFTQKLQRLLADTKIQVYSLHPGLVRTGCFDNIKRDYRLSVLAYPLYPFIWYITKSTKIGALTTIHLACTPTEELVNGGYYRDSQLYSSNAASKDQVSQEALWDGSVKLLTHLGYNI